MYLCVRHLHMFLNKSAFNASLNPMEIPHVSAFSLCRLCHGHLLLQGVLFLVGLKPTGKRNVSTRVTSLKTNENMTVNAVSSRDESWRVRLCLYT